MLNYFPSNHSEGRGLSKSTMVMAFLLNLLGSCHSVIAIPPRSTPINFQDWCSRKIQFPSATQHTIDVLLKEAGSTDCNQAFQKLSAFESLLLDGKQISDLRPLSSLTNLRILRLSENQINDITPLSSLTNLSILYLNLNQVRDIKPLGTLTHLHILNLWRNQVSDITPLSTLIKLGDLDLSNNQVTNLAPLSRLTNLSKLVLKGNSINDLKPLSSLKNLIYLNLSKSSKLTDKTCPIQPESICIF
jgi:internalin A